MKRRKLFSTAFASLLVSACSSPASAKGRRVKERTLTPEQTSGPFYPDERGAEDDADLTVVRGKPAKAKGEVVYIRGKVCDEKGAPLGKALVDIWQACESGRYNHDADTNPAALDPNFQYWGRTTTNAAGEYTLKTIVPGAYKVSETWTRPPHVHFRVSKRGFREVTTQMYFAGNALNDKDSILQALSKDEQESVVVAFEKPASNAKEKTREGLSFARRESEILFPSAVVLREGVFDLVLKSLG